MLKSAFKTAKGSLIRTILFNSERITANNWEAFAFIGFLLIFAIAASMYVLQHGIENNFSRGKLYLECILIVTSVVPPELPMELALAVNTSLLALGKKGIFCTEPFRIPYAGRTDICCFDKTGTLTSDMMVVQGVADAKGDLELNKPDQSPPETLYVMAGCHSLVYLDGEMIGEPMESSAIASIDWHFTKGETVVCKSKCLRIMTRYHFVPELKRMSNIVSLEHEKPAKLMVVTKGAPEALLPLLTEVCHVMTTNSA